MEGAVGRRDRALLAVVFLLLFAFSYSTETAALDLHAMLSRLKLAAGLMRMNWRIDKVSVDDWGLAGVIRKAWRSGSR